MLGAGRPRHRFRAPRSGPAIAAAPGEVVYVSGQVPIDPTNGQLIDDDIRLQTALVLRNLAAILAEAGSGLHQVVKTTVYLKDLRLSAR